MRLVPRTGLPIGDVAARLGTSARMLRYREALGLITPHRRGSEQRRYGPREMAAAACAVECEQRYGVSPKALAFALRTLAEPPVAADVRRLGELAGRALPPSQLAALDFEQEKARRLLRLAG